MIFSPSFWIFKKNLQENFLFCLCKTQGGKFIVREPVMIINRMLESKTCVAKQFYSDPWFQNA